MKRKRLLFAFFLVVLVSGCTKQTNVEISEVVNEQTTENDNIEEMIQEDTVEQIDISQEELGKIYEDVDAWKNDFLMYNETPESTGCTYYISNSGNDKNDGLTPETAWSTLKNTTSSQLHSGDLILLERGGEWNNGEFLPKSTRMWDMVFQVKEGITIGAYGTGERPVIRGDEIGTNEPTNWILFSESGDNKIWVYAKELLDCPVIVFDGGNEYANKIWPRLKAEEYVNCYGEPFDVTEALDADLTFCSLLDTSNDQALIREGVATGNLYLRCDEGNPAEVFEEIAIPQLPVGIHLLKDSRADGIEIEYFTMNGVCMDGYGGDTGMTLSNCELDWCGGLLSEYQDNGGFLSAYASGGPVQISGSDLSAYNNYIHDTGIMSFIISIHADGPDQITFSNISIEDNLIERSGSALHWADLTTMDNSDAQGFISNLEFKNNIVLDTGSGWIKDFYVEESYMWIFLSSIESFMGASRNDGIYITNNIFCCAERELIIYNGMFWCTEEPVDVAPVFAGNTYIQRENGQLALWNGYDKELTQENVASLLGDDTGKIIIIDE